MYGTVQNDDTSGVHADAGHWRRRVLVGVPVAMALALVLVAVVLVQRQDQEQPTELFVKDMDSDVLRHEKQGIAAAQDTLKKLNAKEKMESGLLHKHAVSGKKEAILAKASKTKARASREVAAALLDTVKQHTEEMAKQKDLAEHDKQAAVAANEQAKASELSKEAAAAHAAELKAAARAKRMSLQAAKDQKKLDATQSLIAADMEKVEKDKLAAENKMSDASTEQHLADLGVASSKARTQRVKQLHGKIRRLDRKIEQLKRKYHADMDDEQEDNKAALEYRSQVDSARKHKQELHADAHKLKLKEADESRQAETEERKLENVKELVHDKDNELEHMLSREHEAKTALERAQDRLRNAERRIYHAQMKNEADRDPSDADLGLV